MKGIENMQKAFTISIAILAIMGSTYSCAKYDWSNRPASTSNIFDDDAGGELLPSFMVPSGTGISVGGGFSISY